MREFVLPFKPEELLAQPTDDRLWAQDLPPVDEWSVQTAGKALDSLIGKLLKSRGKDIAEDQSFSLVFALLQGWPRLDEETKPRIADLLADAARRLIAEVTNLKKTSSSTKQKDQDAARELRIACKVAAFFLKWVNERVIKMAQEVAMGASRRGKGRGRGGASAEKDAGADEAKEAQKAAERLRCALLMEVSNLVGKGGMPWLWMGDPSSWQSVAQCVSDAGFHVLDSSEALKHRETRQLSLRCIAEPLLQEGHQHSNLLVATVSKLMHGLRSIEAGASFAADALLLAHTTPLPRLFLVELPGHCNAGELSSQGAFQRALAQFLVAVTERLPHVVLANISVLLPLLDIDCYPLRSAIVESMGALLSAEGRKLPSGAHCDSGRAGGEQHPEGAEGEEGESSAVVEYQEIVKKDKNAPVAHFSIASATKKDLLETLLTRSLDKSVWVRYRVLQTLTSLASNTRVAALPRDQWSRVLEIATRRLQDNASTSRKASMQLVRALIEFHPYGPALQGSGDERVKAQRLLEEVAARFRKLQDEEAEEAEETLAAVGGGDDGQSQKRRRLQKKTVTDMTVEKDIAQALAEDGEACEDPEAERQRQREALIRMRDCYAQRLHFVELLDAAESRLRGLLSSKTNTDVTEAISVVVELRLKGVPAATKAFDQVLGLVWSRHPPIKDAAVDAFNRMHLEGRDTVTAVRSMLEMYEQGCTGVSWTYTHLASVQELIQLSAEKGFIDIKGAIPELVASLSTPACPMALRALTALGAASGTQLAEQLPRIAELMGPKGSAAGTTPAEVLDRSRLLCHMLYRLYTCSKAPLSDEAWKHLWSLCQHAVCVLVECFARESVPAEWFGAAQAAMDLSFELAFSPQANQGVQQCPDKLWEQILGRMLCSVLDKSGSAPPKADAMPICDASGAEEARESGTEGAAVGAGEASAFEGSATVEKVSAARIGCVVFIAGHLALKMLIYLETLQSALKKKRLRDEDDRMTAAREEKKKKPKAKGKKGAKEEEEDGGGEAQSMGMAGQEEREAEAFAEIAESGLIFGAKSMLDRIKPLIFACLMDTNLRNDPVIRRLGAISLCKYMTVSKKFCEENLQLLFSILFPKNKDASAPLSFTQKGDEAGDVARANGMGALLEDLTLRQSLLVAVGDLLFRHPNVVEPWTGRLYSTLGSGTSSSDGQGTGLRLTALLVLTHLVLNDMMKPRAQLLSRVLWLTACTHESTARVSRILFQELSKRSSNVIYNLLPQIIASMPNHQASASDVEGGAEGRVQFVMQFVDKEKHIEGLIEKLAIRLEQAANITDGKAAVTITDTQMAAEDADEGASTPSQAKATVSCLSHALSGMNYTDRCVLRLHDAVVVRKVLHTALAYNEVTRDCVLQIVDKCRKAKAAPKLDGGAPPEAEPDAAAPDNAAPANGKSGVSAAAAAALDAIESTVNGLAKGKEEDPDHPAPVPDDGAAAAPAGSKAAGKGRGKGAKRKAAAEEDENAGFDEEPAGRKKGAGRGRGGGAAKAVAKKHKGKNEDDDYEP